MATTVVGPLVCPQGHGPGVPGSRFCTMCGAGLVGEGQMIPAQPVVIGAPPGIVGHPLCKVCGLNGAGLSAAEIVCPQCGWLRPLAPGYQLDRSVFLWAQDGQAMSKLQSISALHAVVRNVSDKVGRPWIESTFNAIKLGPRQFTDVWNLAVLAARILGLPKMPDVYISGDQMWNTYTYGTENSSFIVLGTSHLINFAGDELLFVLAREMGHCRAGHALWNTVLRFIAGDVSVHTGLLSNGLINAINPTKLIQGAIDLPLMAWSRQSEITADRAGLMAVGDEALVRRVLLAWSIRSARLLQQVNIDEWLKQESASDDSMTRFSEMTTSSSMYTTRRLRLLGQAAHEAELMRWSQSIQPVRLKLAPVATQAGSGLGVGTVRKATPAPVTRPPSGAPRPPVGAGAPMGTTHMAGGASGEAANQAAVTANAAQGVATAPTDSIRVICNKCHAAMRVPLAMLRGKTTLNVRCPQCKTVIVLRPRAAAPAAGATAGSAPAPAAQAATPAAGETKPAAPPAAASSVAAKSVAPPPEKANGAAPKPMAPLTVAHGAAAKSFGAKAGAVKHGAPSPAHTGSKK
ncbi:MAG: M48 family metallopeptidase [Terracidiphilus sp.]|nr:M48 family metallopeptidase [Terracidiphilus sp.]MDR3797299.1 M48 family metallopeptidase [Terracidiphilus sp.]